MKKSKNKKREPKPLFANPVTNWRVNAVWMGLLLLFPIVLWALPSTTFDKTGFELCPSKLFFDFECWGCGITRAVMHLHHFEFEEAIYYHALVYLIYPLLAYIWFLWLKDAYNIVKAKPSVIGTSATLGQE